MTFNSPKRPPYWNSTSGFNLTVSSQSACHSAPVCVILSKSDGPRQKNDVTSNFKMADLRHLGFYGSNNGFFENSCTTSYRSSIETIALNCFVIEKIAMNVLATETDEQMDSSNALSRPRCRERRLNKGLCSRYC